MCWILLKVLTEAARKHPPRGSLKSLKIITINSPKEPHWIHTTTHLVHPIAQGEHDKSQTAKVLALASST
jgi:hypothetical protein